MKWGLSMLNFLSDGNSWNYVEDITGSSQDFLCHFYRPTPSPMSASHICQLTVSLHVLVMVCCVCIDVDATIPSQKTDEECMTDSIKFCFLTKG